MHALSQSGFEGTTDRCGWEQEQSYTEELPVPPGAARGPVQPTRADGGGPGGGQCRRERSATPAATVPLTAPAAAPTSNPARAALRPVR